VNSINWARIAAQIVYYVWAGLKLGVPARTVAFAVPTGNFGNVLAGFVAQKMGLPVERFIVGTNANDVLARVIATGEAALAAVAPTSSPSMDIQVSSNFERLIFEASGRNAGEVRRVMDGLAQSRAYRLDAATRAAIRAAFSAHTVDEAATEETIGRIHRQTGYLLDPHTAVGVKAAEAHLAQHAATPVVVLATAHPAKFPDVVERATGLRPALPPHLADLLERDERTARLANDLGVVEAWIAERARVAQEAAA
jgi:threonine synthase